MLRNIVHSTQLGADNGEVLLACGHRTTPAAAQAVIADAEQGPPASEGGLRGPAFDCRRCERFEWPEEVVAYKRTPEFTAETIPAGLRKDHSTKPGVWARIVVLEGRLHYRVESLAASFELAPDLPGTVVPEVLHHVAAPGPVRFYVEFYRNPALP